jgi:hypothetical protein
MLINKCWAVCQAKAYTQFNNNTTKPVAYLSDELCKNLFFFKPNLCDLIIKEKKYEFYVLPTTQKFNTNDIFYNNHIINIPVNIYHQLIGFKENLFLSVRTDLF